MKLQEWRDLVSAKARGLLMNATHYSHAVGICEGAGDSPTGAAVSEACALADSADEMLYRYIAKLESRSIPPLPGEE